MDRTHAVVIFVDIRRCTQWMTGVGSVDVLEGFLNAFYRLLHTTFSDASFKALGDGALLVARQPSPPHRSAIEAMLHGILNGIAAVEQGFVALCERVELTSGHTTRLQLGWGVTRGIVHVLTNDYLGMIINEASRLCQLARPYGVVIDREDFPSLPLLTGLPFAFTPAMHQLAGMTHETPLWVSFPVVLLPGA